ncbi:hypothetical protein BH09BAC5_BH09BAC5_12390 [soil metagenome]
MQREIEMLDAIVEHGTEGIIVADKKGILRMVNPSAERIFGYERGELNGKTIEILLPPRYKEKHVGQRNGYIEKPAPRAMGHGLDLYGRRKDGSEILVEVSLSPFNTSQGQFIMSFIVDVTSRKKNETELKLAHERLKQTSEALSTLNAELEEKVRDRTDELAEAIQKLADSKQEVMRALEREIELNELKSRFITTASHEFRTPLGTILSSASLLLRYTNQEDQDKRKKHIERIKSSVHNLTEILNDFLSIEKLEEGIVNYKPEEVNFSELGKEIVDDLQNITKTGQKILYSYKGIEQISLDSQLMRNALINLISNAIKYSPEEKEIFVNILVENAICVIEIIDNGIGIPDEDQQHIFERFFRAKNCGNVQGTGLGLNIVNKYIELMSGKISFKSKYGKGSTFRIEFPV